MVTYINVPLREGEFERDRFNHVNIVVLERQYKLLEAMCESYDFKGQDAVDAEGLRRFFTRIIADLKIGDDTNIFVR